MVVYEVGYEMQMSDEAEFEYPARPNPSHRKSLLADNAEDAIAILRTEEIGTVLEWEDDDGKEQASEIVDVLICCVQVVCVLDITP